MGGSVEHSRFWLNEPSSGAIRRQLLPKGEGIPLSPKGVREDARLSTGYGERGQGLGYFTSLRRSAVLRLSLVIATGVNSVICCAGLVPSLRKLVRISTPVALCLAGNCSIVAVISPSRILPRVSGSASKPMMAMPLRLRALTASSAPSAMSSLPATITCGGVAKPASAASVTERPLERSKPAVCSKTILYLSAALSSTLCRPLLG